MQANSSANRRCFYFDLIRAVACLFVVMGHTSVCFVSAPLDSIDFWVGNTFDSLIRASVPLFVMISGALMLDENYRYTHKKLIGHILRMVAFFVFWSVIYALVYEVAIPMSNHEPVKITNVLWAIISGHFHLWFIPMIIGVYLLVPLLRMWVKKENKKGIEYFLVLSLIFAFIIPQGIDMLVCISPKLVRLNELMDTIDMKYTLSFTSYFILGWYLHNFEVPKKKLIYALGVAGAAMTVLGTYAERAWFGSTEYLFYKFFTLNVLFCSVGYFVLFKSIYANKQNVSPALRRTVDLVSKYSLGVYAVHMFFVHIVYSALRDMNALAATPIICVASSVLSVLFSMLLSKIPLLRRFV